MAILHMCIHKCKYMCMHMCIHMCKKSFNGPGRDTVFLLLNPGEGVYTAVPG